MKGAVVIFPGSLADEVVSIYDHLLKVPLTRIWYREESFGAADFVVVPGGAAFGDYLRPGALTRGTPVASALRKFALEGGPILGIGNGFQILCELEILPGVLLVNQDVSYLNGEVCLVGEGKCCAFGGKVKTGAVLKLPLACYYGRYWADKRTIKDLEENQRIIFRYSDADGDVDPVHPFNGCLNSIAAITNQERTILGIMAHPERAVEGVLSGIDGLELLLPGK